MECINSTPALRARVQRYLDQTGMTITALGKELNYSRATVSRYLSGNYDGRVEEVEEKIIEFLMRVGGEVGTDEDHVMIRKRENIFYSTDANSVLGVCQSCQTYAGMGIVVGKSGFGKTYTLKEYAMMKHVSYIECDDTMSSRDLIEAIERTIGIYTSYGTIWKRVNEIRKFFNTTKGYLLIIDEADKLISKYTQKKMEIIRAIFDQSDVGIVIAGEPKLEAQIKGYLDRMANRIDFYASLKGLNEREVIQYLKDYSVDDAALRELKRRACGGQSGCFRLFDRTMNNVIRILNDSGETKITMQTVDQASNMMML